MKKRDAKVDRAKMNRLAESFKKAGFNLHETSKLGNCLFQSVGYYLDMDHLKVRSLICSSLEKHPELMEHSDGLSITKAIRG